MSGSLPLLVPSATLVGLAAATLPSGVMTNGAGASDWIAGADVVAMACGTTAGCTGACVGVSVVAGMEEELVGGVYSMRDSALDGIVIETKVADGAAATVEVSGSGNVRMAGRDSDRAEVASGAVTKVVEVSWRKIVVSGADVIAARGVVTSEESWVAWSGWFEGATSVSAALEGATRPLSLEVAVGRLIEMKIVSVLPAERNDGPRVNMRTVLGWAASVTAELAPAVAAAGVETEEIAADEAVTEKTEEMTTDDAVAVPVKVTSEEKEVEVAGAPPPPMMVVVGVRIAVEVAGLAAAEEELKATERLANEALESDSVVELEKLADVEAAAVVWEAVDVKRAEVAVPAGLVVDCVELEPVEVAEAVGDDMLSEVKRPTGILSETIEEVSV